jgi:hypothetical protein
MEYIHVYYIYIFYKSWTTIGGTEQQKCTEKACLGWNNVVPEKAIFSNWTGSEKESFTLTSHVSDRRSILAKSAAAIRGLRIAASDGTPL